MAEKSVIVEDAVDGKKIGARDARSKDDLSNDRIVQIVDRSGRRTNFKHSERKTIDINQYKDNSRSIRWSMPADIELCKYEIFANAVEVGDADGVVVSMETDIYDLLDSAVPPDMRFIVTPVLFGEHLIDPISTLESKVFSFSFITEEDGSKQPIQQIFRYPSFMDGDYGAETYPLNPFSDAEILDFFIPRHGMVVYWLVSDSGTLRLRKAILDSPHEPSSMNVGSISTININSHITSGTTKFRMSDDEKQILFFDPTAKEVHHLVLSGPMIVSSDSHTLTESGVYVAHEVSYDGKRLYVLNFDLSMHIYNLENNWELEGGVEFLETVDISDIANAASPPGVSPKDIRIYGINEFDTPTMTLVLFANGIICSGFNDEEYEGGYPDYTGDSFYCDDVHTPDTIGSSKDTVCFNLSHDQMRLTYGCDSSYGFGESVSTYLEDDYYEYLAGHLGINNWNVQGAFKVGFHIQIDTDEALTEYTSTVSPLSMFVKTVSYSEDGRKAMVDSEFTPNRRSFTYSS
jgi:hypothetical protein